MVGSVVGRKRNIHGGTKVKTGCATCRIRKVKCDEAKPFCQKCVNTGRACDGYESLFRFCINQSVDDSRLSGAQTEIGRQSVRLTSTEIALQDIKLLNRCFSIKTIHGVKLDCDEEARQVLQASLTDTSIRHAVSSLKALRTEFEMFENGYVSATRQLPSYDYGLQQYGKALEGVVSNLSSPNSDKLRSALLCCQIFISIEQVQGNYAAMAQHIVQGLKIMQGSRARSGFTAADKLGTACRSQVPLLDVFIIKLFMAPCKFADPPTRANVSGTESDACPVPPHQQAVGHRSPRKIAPDTRAELTRIAGFALEFLDRMSQATSAGHTLQLLSERMVLLNSLESWLIDLDLIQQEIEPHSPEPVPVSFMRLFYLILKIVLLGTLNCSPKMQTELQTEHDRFQSIANTVDERLGAYRMRHGNSRGGRERSEVH